MVATNLMIFPENQIPKFHAEFPEFYAEFTDLLTVAGVVPKPGVLRRC